MTDEQRANVKLWIEALRSGEYEQAKAALRKGNSYCCLGVACDLYQKVGPGDLREERDLFDDRISYNSHIVNLPDEVAGWLGLATPAGDYTDHLGRPRALTADNDGLGEVFEQIADTIEAALDDPSMKLFAQEAA